MTNSASTSSTVSISTPLKREELLAKVQELKGKSPEELAMATGYVSKKGKPQINAFNHALGVANGYFTEEATPSHTAARKGRQPSYTATIAATGNAVIGAAYTAAIGLSAGDKIKIIVDESLGMVSFVKVNAESSAVSEQKSKDTEEQEGEKDEEMEDEEMEDEESEED